MEVSFNRDHELMTLLMEKNKLRIEYLLELIEIQKELIDKQDFEIRVLNKLVEHMHDPYWQDIISMDLEVAVE